MAIERHGWTSYSEEEYMATLGLSTGRFAFDWFKTQGPLTEALQRKFGRNDLISGHSHPYLYLNLEAISSAGLDLVDVERFVADELMKIPGIAYALTRSDLLAGRITESPVQNQIRRSFHPARSGNIHMVPEQYWFLHSTEEAAFGVPRESFRLVGDPESLRMISSSRLTSIRIRWS